MGIGRREFLIGIVGVTAVGAVTGGISCLKDGTKDRMNDVLSGEVETRFAKLTGMLDRAKRLTAGHPEECKNAGVKTDFHRLEAAVVAPIMELVRSGEMSQRQAEHVSGIFWELTFRLEEALGMDTDKEKIMWLGIGDDAHVRDWGVTLATVLAMHGGGELPVRPGGMSSAASLTGDFERLSGLMEGADRVQHSDPELSRHLRIRTNFRLEQRSDRPFAVLMRRARDGDLRKNDAAAVQHIVAAMISGLEAALRAPEAEQTRMLAAEDDACIRDAVTALETVLIVVQKRQ